MILLASVTMVRRSQEAGREKREGKTKTYHDLHHGSFSSCTCRAFHFLGSLCVPPYPSTSENEKGPVPSLSDLHYTTVSAHIVVSSTTHLPIDAYPMRRGVHALMGCGLLVVARISPHHLQGGGA